MHVTWPLARTHVHALFGPYKTFGARRGALRTYRLTTRQLRLLAVAPRCAEFARCGLAQHIARTVRSRLVCVCAPPCPTRPPIARAGYSFYHARTMGITESKLRDQDGTPLKFKDASPTEGGISHASPLAGRNACSTSKESRATTHRLATTAGARPSVLSGPDSGPHTFEVGCRV